MINSIFKGIIFFLISLLIVEIKAQKVITLSPNEKERLISNQIQYFVDSSANLTFEEILQKSKQGIFKYSNNIDGLNFGVTSSAIWLRIDVKNESFRQIPQWIFQTEYPLIDYVEYYYQKDSTWQKQVLGDYNPFSLRKIPLRKFTVFLPFSNHEIHQFYFCFRSRGSMQIKPSIHSPIPFAIKISEIELGFGIFYGIMIVMFFYNLIIYITIKDINYIFYCLSILSTIGLQASYNGHTLQFLWGDNVYFANKIVPFFMASTSLTSTLFSISFLNSKKYAPILHKILLFLMSISGIIMILSFFIDERITISSSGLFAILSILLMLITGLKCFFSGKKAARFFVIAWSSYLLGALLIGFRNFGLLPSNFITSHAIQIGSILEVFLLSLALGDRYRIFKEEKEKAQEDLLRVQHEAKEALEVKVKERTEELNEANEELSQTNEELSITLEQLNHQKIVVQEKNEDILASITYAKRIQMAMLPFTEKMNACLKEYFILYKPRDIVSGDFYWVDKIGDKITIVVGDCTGHGVPGAFMSVLGMSYLEEIIIAKHITTPNIILEMLNKGIRYALKQDTTDSRDGMDVAILIIDSSSQIFEFAGAMNPLYFVSDNQLTEIKGDKLPIGGTQREPNRFFNNHALVLKPNTTFYLCTDGYQDQFGGGKGKKFMVKRLKEMLTNISIEPLNKQHEILDTTINNWIVEGKEAQIDDITILGLRV